MDSNFLRTQAAWRAMSRVVAARRRAEVLGDRDPFPDEPDWLRPELVRSIALVLPDPRDPGRSKLTWERAPSISIAIADGLPASAIPSRLKLNGPDEGPALRVVRSAPVQGQCAPCIQRVQGLAFQGTATVLLRDTLAPQRNYLLTCAHVIAPQQDAGTRFDAPVAILATPGGASITGRLVEWHPAAVGSGERSNVDAALIEVSPEDTITLRALTDFLPASVGGGSTNDLTLNRPVTVRRMNGPLPGALRSYWSGMVNLEGQAGVPDYFLVDGIGYTTTSLTVAGDSGAAVWGDGDELLGMHIGADDSGAGDVTAIMAPLQPVLDLCRVQPYTRSGGGSGTSARPLDTVPMSRPSPTCNDDAGQIDVVARTLWGEARGEPDAGMRGVGSVISTRVRKRWSGATTPAQVCLAHAQFSCWNDNDPNRPQLARIAPNDAAFLRAQAIARLVVSSSLPDDVSGATHYISSTLRMRPHWLDGLAPCAVLGRLEFYKNVP